MHPLVKTLIIGSSLSNYSSHNMNHSGHMDHSDHMDHSGHNMDHSGHNMDHSGLTMDHSGHTMDHSSVIDDSSVIGVDPHASHSPSTHMGGMKMYFHFGVDETILFYGWKTSTTGGLIGSMIGIFLLALFYEGLKYFREFLFKRYINSSRYAATCNKSNSNDDKPVQMNIMSLGHFLQTLLHVIQFIVSYCLMLIFMTYNVWLCLACTLGAGMGYFLFGWKKSVVVDVTEHCH